ATIASTDIELLLRDDLFVDFFNTFLNLPVFGQTPVYISSLGRWDLWPELPSHLDPSPPALLAWLEKHRLPHFCKSSLCLHLILCQKLLAFTRSREAAKLLNWQSSDQWLLEKCISGSHGIWHFRAFVQGMAGEQLINFWLTTERLLGLNESDAKQRELYLSLLQRLEATHLRKGSSIITLCRTVIGSPPEAGHIQPISTRRENLSKMQEQALFMIQSYWLPKFYIHCKKDMEDKKLCRPLLQEYQEPLLQDNWQDPSSFSKDLFTMHIKRSQGLSGPYCSRKARAEMWATVKGGGDAQEMKTPRIHVQPERQSGPTGSKKESCLDRDALGPVPQQSEHSANTDFRCKGRTTSPKRPRTDEEHIYKEEVFSNVHPSMPPVQLPSLKNPVKTLSFLPWALSADSCAGRPFRDFLKHQSRSMEAYLLDLWHDLEEFLPVALNPNSENSFFLRHLLGEKICKTYLEEGSIQHLPLEISTLRSLWDPLMAGEFSPRIFRAQKEICKVLCCFYEEFLADDDRMFLQFMCAQNNLPVPEMQDQAVGKDECFLLYQRINNSLKLSQALHGTGNFESLCFESWQLIKTQNLQEGIPIQTEVEPPLHRTGKRRLYISSRAWDQLYSVPTAAEPKRKKKTPLSMRKTRSGTKKPVTVVVEKPSKRPRHFVKVLHNPAHLQYFKQFLEERNADEPLRFWMSVEKLSLETNPKTKSSLINSIVRNYFHAETPAEEQLDCHSSIIEEIREAKEVSPFMLVTAQIFVQQAMEKRWFKEYQALFPQSDTPKSNLHLQHGTGNFMTDKLRCAWYAIHDIVKSISKFQREMNNHEHRMEFEAFLRRELGNEEESMA
ncbi:RGSL protein, partial [Turnix velox]|nr:RGSL protein [Turnix velox]